MKFTVNLEIPDSSNIVLELDDGISPKTVRKFMASLPFSADLNVWGDEIYTGSTPITNGEENARPLVELNDVAYWPAGKAICLFYGPTPIGNKGEIKPDSPVNVIGKILNPDKTALKSAENATGTFSKA